MPLPSFLRRSKPSFEQLDLFSGFAVAAPEPVEVVADLPPVIQPAALVPAEPQAVPPSDTGDQSTIPECDRFIVDLPEPVRPSRDFRITEAHRIGQGGIAEKMRDNITAIRTLKAIEAAEREATEEERAVLVRYVGWGAMPKVFDRWQPDQRMTEAADELRELLTDTEHAAAKASTPNAHYTSPLVIEAIWNGLRRMGVGGGVQILEPAMGIGHFFGLMPNDMQGSNRTGVELDPITARIAKQLYPDATIFARGFEETTLPDNYMDVVVGNVPFGDYAVHDPTVKRGMTRAIHDYFFAKSLQKLRPGGVMALITSRYTMDKETDNVRKYLGDEADLLGAIRLPNTAFKENAGTAVTTDILFLRKREPGERPAGHAWRELALIDVDDYQMTKVNEYFAMHPEMMLGQMTVERGRYGNPEPTLTGELTPELLSAAIQQLPAGVYIPRDQQRPPPAPITEPDAFVGVKDGAYVEQGGVLYIRTGNTLDPAVVSGPVASRVRGQMAIRDALREVFSTQLEDQTDAAITSARLELNLRYDAYTHRFGPLSSRDNTRAFAGDPDQPLLLSLENYNAEAKTATKTAIFQRRTLQRHKAVESVSTAAEALAISLNETGGIDWQTMHRLTGRSPKRLQRELDAMIYRNPEGEWETADNYLSGDVRAKLRTALAASELDAVFARNVSALEAVQPEDLLPGDISARLGSPWIPTSDVKQFIVETLAVPAPSLSVSHSGVIASWAVTADWNAKASVSNTTTHGSGRATALELIDDALNGRVPTIYDQMADETRVVNQLETIAAREAQQKLKDSFSQWVWQDEDRAQRLSRTYNDKFNNIRLRTYDGSHQTFPGLNRTSLRDNDLDKHQKDAVWRIIQNDNTLLAHVVGAGKTAVCVVACMELKRLGLVDKPMIAVPNHLVDQWGTAFLSLYPQANIFVAGKDFFTGANRQNAMARIASGRYDAVIVSHSSFEKIPVSDETFEDFVGRQIDRLEEAVDEAKSEKGDTRRTVKEIEKAKKRLVAKLKERADRENKDDGVTFEQMGVDRIFVDESDCFPYDTQVLTDEGPFPVGQIVEQRLGVNVLSFDTQSGKHEWKPVTDWIKKTTTERLVRVTHEHGSFTCTANHEAWTEEGYTAAASLLPHQSLQVLREHVRDVGKQQGVTCTSVLQPYMQGELVSADNSGHKGLPRLRSAVHIQEQWGCQQREAENVQQSLRGTVSASASRHEGAGNGEVFALLGTDERDEVSRVIDSYANQKSYVEPGECGEAQGFHAGTSTASQGRKRQVAATCPADPCRPTGLGDGVRGTHENREAVLREASELLQGGYGPPADENSYRVRRTWPQIEPRQVPRRQEGRGLAISRVVSVEVQQPGHHRELGPDSEPGQTVYCLEVEGNHNFYADGVLVSNCYKNLSYISKMQRIAGLPNSESNRALDMYLKTQYLGERKGGVVFATGTPISNTMAEMYTMQRYLDPGALRAAGVEHFDAWAANFGEAVTSLELAPDGSGYRMHTRFSKFVNLPELLSMFRTFADVQTADMLNLPRPALEGGRPQIVAAPITPELKAFVATLVERSQNLKNVDPSVDNMLKITGDGRKAALDMRIIDPDAEPCETKVDRAIDRVFATWDATQDRRLTQLVFCDLSTPNPHRFNVYSEVRERLIARGVPEKEVAFIHDADTDAKKKALFDSVNAGRIRILLGSTEKMGAGTNVQKRLKALHHLDAPWRPRDIEQREGRILRQGNDNETVEIHRYVTEGSFDAYMWQCLETKARFINQVMNGSVTVRQAEDVEGGALTYAEIKAIASGNPAVMEKVRVDTEVRKLDQLQASYINQQHKIKWQVRSLPEEIERCRNYHAAYSEDVATRDANAGDEFAMTVGNRTFSGKDGRTNAGDALNQVAYSWRDDKRLQVRGHYRGFDILTMGSEMRDAAPDLYVRGKETYKANLNLDSPLGTIASIEHVLRGLDRRAEIEAMEVARREKQLADYRTQMNRLFEHADRLKELLVKQAALNASLDLDKSDTQTVADTPEQPKEVAKGASVPFDSHGWPQTASVPGVGASAVQTLKELLRHPAHTLQSEPLG